MKADKNSKFTAQFINNPRQKMKASVQLHDPADLPPLKDQWYPLNSRLDSPESLSGRFGKEKHISPVKKSSSSVVYSWSLLWVGTPPGAKV